MLSRYRHGAVFGYFMLLMLVMTYPLVRVFNTHLIGDPFSDATEYVHHIWWMTHAIRTGQNPFFVPELAYPDGLSAAWLWSAPFQSFPAWAFALVMPLPIAYNLAFIIHLSLNGWAMYRLTRRLTDNEAAGLVGGSVFAMMPAIQGHLIASHVGLVTLWPSVLYADEMLRFDEGRGRYWRAALFFMLALGGSNLLLVYVLFPLTVGLFARWLLRCNWQNLRRGVVAVMLGSLLAMVFVVPAVLDQLNGTQVEVVGNVMFSADLLAIVTPSFYNPLFTDLTYSRTILGGVNNIEGTATIGLLSWLLMAIALWRRPESRWWGGIALLAWVFSLGPLLKVLDEVVMVNLGEYPTHVVLPWAFIADLPLLNITRTPARFNFAVGLAVAVIVAYGVAAWWSISRPRWRWLWLALLISGVWFESLVWWENGVPALRTIPMPTANDPAVVAIRDDDTVRAVFNLPHDHTLAAKDGMLYRIFHGKPMIAGHISRATPVSLSKREVLQDTLDAALLDAASVDMVILHRWWADADGELEQFARDMLGEPLHEDDRLVVWRVPDSSAAPQFVALPFDDTRDFGGTATHFYAPTTGRVTVSGPVAADNLPLSVLLNGQPVHTFTAQPDTTLDVQVFVTDAGYHTIEIAPVSDCISPRLPQLTCPRITAHVALTAWDAASPPSAIVYEAGITLDAYAIGTDANGDYIALSWAFDAPPSAESVRFVHVVDADGELIAQYDDALHAVVGESIRHDETLRVSLGTNNGPYKVYAGWYRYPDLMRFPILTDVEGAADGWAQIGVFTDE